MRQSNGQYTNRLNKESWRRLRSTSNQSSEPCAVAQYPSKTHVTISQTALITPVVRDNIRGTH